MPVDINVKQLDEIKYLAQHEYYTRSEVNVRTGSYNSDQDRYYDVKDPTTRVSLAKLMTRYCLEDQNQDYIIGANNPMFIDPADCNGIDSPDLTSIKADEKGFFHANQKLKLMATDVNTNSESAGTHAFSIKAH
jgi:hypothetical protein